VIRIQENMVSSISTSPFILVSIDTRPAMLPGIDLTVKFWFGTYPPRTRLIGDIFWMPPVLYTRTHDDEPYGEYCVSSGDGSVYFTK
jgi:hypothetical protein